MGNGEVERQMAREQKRIAKEEVMVRERIKQENEKIARIQTQQKLEIERRKNDAGRAAEQLQQTINKAKSLPVGTCLSVSFLPFMV